MAFRLEHVHLKTKDPQKTATFYMECLGATLIESTHGNTRFRLNLHGVTLNVTDFIEYQVRQQNYGVEHFALQTDDLDRAVAKLKASGARVLEEMVSRVPAHEGMRICWLEGPEGVQLEMIEVKAI